MFFGIAMDSSDFLSSSDVESEFDELSNIGCCCYEC